MHQCICGITCESVCVLHCDHKHYCILVTPYPIRKRDVKPRCFIGTRTLRGILLLQEGSPGLETTNICQLCSGKNLRHAPTLFSGFDQNKIPLSKWGLLIKYPCIIDVLNIKTHKCIFLQI